MKYLFLIIFVSSTYVAVAQKRENKYLKLFPEMEQLLNKKNYVSQSSYWMLVQSSDSTCKIKWNTSSITRETKDNFNFYWARHFHLEWKNGNFIALHTHTGSDAWLNVFLPLNKKRKEIIIDGPIAFDSNNNLVAAISYGDTILKVTNLLSGKQQSIIEKKKKCSSAFNGYCIDKVSFHKNMLYFSWILPDKLKTKTQIEVHKVRLHI